MSSNVSDSIAGNPAPPQAASNSPAVLAPTEQQESRPGVPKKITNAQTVCNERNEKGKLCNGHLKQVRTGGEEAAEHLRGDDVLFKCQACGTLYMGPPLGHVRDPDKQSRFVQRELTALLQAAGGTLPLIRKNEKGVYVLVEEGAQHAPAKPAHAATTPAPAAPGPSVAETPEEKKARLGAEATARMKAAEGAKPATAAPAAKPAPKPTGTAKSLGPIPGASGPVPGETHEQKIARLRAVVAEAKRRAEMAEAAGEDETSPATQTAETQTVHTQPTAASTAGTDSSAQADLHRPAAEAQAATGLASAAPLSPTAATASPASGAETVADLAPEASTEKTPAAPQASAAPGAKGKRAAFDTGPVPGETHEQKIARLRAVVAAAKERAESGG